MRISRTGLPGGRARGARRAWLAVADSIHAGTGLRRKLEGQLHGMAGILCEWCWDWYETYTTGSQADPRGPISGLRRVLRGGAWCDDADDCRAARNAT